MRPEAFHKNNQACREELCVHDWIRVIRDPIAVRARSAKSAPSLRDANCQCTSIQVNTYCCNSTSTPTSDANARL